ncbi:MAG: hypothetical protein P4M12_02520, partial [Gammaproteobacteria bacterium]|nr:hypothetical protein [Gammaproteobacteria bacterium]
KRFAGPNERLNFKDALYKGELLESVQINGMSVTLTLKEAYDSESYYKSINKTFYDLYHHSDDFKAKFKKPKGSGKPQLTLNANHGY